MPLPTNKTARKERPIARGVLDYFPDAITAVANVSYVGNQQHNPGEDMHWAREKSSDHADCIVRHLIDRGTADDDGLLHSAKVAWRALALLQLEIEDRWTPTPADVWAEDSSTVRYGTGSYEGPSGYRPGQTIPVDGPLDRVDLMREIAEDQADPQQVFILDPPPAQPEYPAEALDRTYLLYRSGPPQHEPVDRNAATYIGVRRRLIELGCRESVARQVASGVTPARFGGAINGRTPAVYLAGPMRGLPDNNFAAFDAHRDRLTDIGFLVISPADIDRAADDIDYAKQTDYAYRDFHALHLLACDKNPDNGIALMPGWENSVGANAEYRLAKWMGLKVYHLPQL